MKKYIVIVSSFLLSTCMHDYSKIVFTHYSSDLKKQQKIKYSAQIPKGFVLKTYKAGGEVGTENQYSYSDSSVIYISDFASSINEQNIRNEGYASKKFEYNMKKYSSNNDTLILSGKNQNELYWKEVIIGKICFGYIEVRLEKKNIFDKALNTIKR